MLNAMHKKIRIKVPLASKTTKMMGYKLIRVATNQSFR